MPKKKGKHLQFYIDCMQNNAYMPVIPTLSIGGLCSMSECKLIDKNIFELFKYGHNEFEYWADGSVNSIINSYRRRYKFTPLRQNIVLLMACLNDEL